MTESTGIKPPIQCLCIDIEASKNDKLTLHELGLFRPDTDAREKILGKAKDLVARTDAMTQGTKFVLGHNVIAFDQPLLQLLHPSLALHQLPFIDTLELSPVAFPQNPYHKLVKDYKLCTGTRNDPVRDAELAFELFLDQQNALQTREKTCPDETLCLHYLLGRENGKGVADLFASIRKSLRPSLEETRLAWNRVTAGKVCITGQKWLLENCLPNDEWHHALAYTLAWLRVSGGNSVLPPWVRFNFPKTRDLISLLRDTPCDSPECEWCREEHDLLSVLPKFFPGITSFRSSPQTPDGKSLQQTIVENGYKGKPTLAILPTGGGKSLCFQLPALSRFYRNGSLTVVISPLQSLMKDQVDNLEARGVTCAGYLNSLLMPIERKMMLEKLRLGDLGLIFVAPEQFRSVAFLNALRHREIGAWVFDEAHCLSKWGHDFRPDYLYVAKEIRKQQKENISPIFCFTATAKPDVITDIQQHFKEHLNVALDLLEGGVKRDNLEYEVLAVPAQAKLPELLRLLQATLKEEGGAIVFCARQKTVEEVAEFLQEAGLDCGAFHGGMESEKKRDIQESFVQGRLRVIAATNAFGMGVDKPDVRLVVHLDTPGSLENYLQEAGRAGRDQDPARCVLLYDETDLDIQFRLLRNSRLTQHDIQTILKALRSIERKDRAEGEVVVTSGEILLELPDTQRIDPDASDSDTKVRIAIAWLEEARLLERHENKTSIYPGSLLVSNIDQAKEQLQKANIADTLIPTYLAILSVLMQAEDNDGISTDELVLATGTDTRQVQKMLRDLDRLKLLSNDMEIGVTLYPEPDTPTRLTSVKHLENALIDNLRKEAPDADQEGWQFLDMRRLCDTLRRDSGVDIDPDKLSRLLKSFAEPFGEGAGQRGFFSIRPGGKDHRYLKLLRSWSDIDNIRTRRYQVAEALVAFFLGRRQGLNLLVTCKQGELENHLQSDITLQTLSVKDWGVAINSALLYLDSNEVLHLARGKAVFRAAMNIKLNDDARRRQFSKADYAELALHYKDKIIQVHVMAEYARLALGKIQAALLLIRDYFSMDRDTFVKTYFSGKKEILEMATTEAAYKKILTDLKNPEQQLIVSTSLDGNHLVLAGPGSGKTRVIVHRVAWLLRVCQVLPEEIMVLAYNRSAAIEIQKRLWALVGSDAAGVIVQTLHGLALRITGISFAVAAERGEAIDFSSAITKATALLSETESSEDGGTSIRRDRLLAGLRYLLVDEYQDINGDHYELISAIAGKSLSNAQDRVNLFAVGDDDQNVYAFNHTSTKYIRQFEQDYQARTYYLVENYRSTRNIIDCANLVINRSNERMKAGHEIRINHDRKDWPAGGECAKIDHLTEGRVHILVVPRELTLEVQLVAAEMQRIYSQTPKESWGNFAVLARRWEYLEPLAALFKQQNVPFRLLREGEQPDLHTTREGQNLLDLLRGKFRRCSNHRFMLRPSTLSRWFGSKYKQPTDVLIHHPGRSALAQFINEIELSMPRVERVISEIIESIYDFRHGRETISSSNGEVCLLTAHRAKGQEYDHVFVLDGNGWGQRNDEERRLFYVAMTRARKTLTICSSTDNHHSFLSDFSKLALYSKPQPPTKIHDLDVRFLLCKLQDIVLSWPGCFAPSHKIHRNISNMDYSDVLQIVPRSDGNPGWELQNEFGEAVGRMAKGFKLPEGKVVSVKVGYVLVRYDHGTTEVKPKCDHWELVLPEITYRPNS